MWFGDLVTMKWWDDLWLKESFADYMGTLGVDRATDWDTAWVNFANKRKAWAYVQDQLPTTHPIVADIPDLEAAKQNFDGITYAKGASVLKQLVAYVGFEAFIAGSRQYFRDHAYGNTTLSGSAGCPQRRVRTGPGRMGAPVAADIRHLHSHQPRSRKHDGVTRRGDAPAGRDGSPHRTPGTPAAPSADGPVRPRRSRRPGADRKHRGGRRTVPARW